MATYVWIDDTLYFLDTQAEIDEAKTALRASARTQVTGWAGDPDGVEGDTYPNGQILFADSQEV